MAITLNPALAAQSPYPFLQLDEARRRALERGVRIIDFSIGDPHERNDPAIREAPIESVEERSRYPKAEGLPEHREAIASWIAARFGVALDPKREVVPTLGSKEALFSLPQVVMDPRSTKNLVVVTEPGYPVPERAARIAGGRVLRLPLLEDRHFLPDLGHVPEAAWDEVAIFYVNYPNNPTGATAPVEFYERLAERARRHSFVLVSDEAYSEIYFDGAPASVLQAGDRSHVVAVNSQSKRSSMTGYRSGFVAGSPEVIAALKLYRPVAGTAVPEFIQRASIAAWGREDHVASMRRVYAAKREIFVDLFARKGIRVAGSQATFFLWCEVPDGETGDAFAARLLEAGILVAPGAMFGPAGEGYFRLALVPTLEECRQAAALLETVL